MLLQESKFIDFVTKSIDIDIDFIKKFISIIMSKEKFCIDLNLLVEYKIYTTRNIQLKLNNFLDEQYNDLITINCFKKLCLLANNNIGKTIYNNYLELETIYTKYLEQELQTLKQDKIDLEKRYNVLLQKHHFYKFKIRGPCFYIIESGLNYTDKITRVKIGIAGCLKRKNIDEENDSIDTRLNSHRVLWPQLQVRFLVYTRQASLLEKNIKTIFSNNINPNGHEIIEGVSVVNIINETKSLLNTLNKYKEEHLYQIEENIELYNSKAVIVDKNK